MGARIEQWKARGQKAAEVGGRVLGTGLKVAGVLIIAAEALGELQTHHQAIQDSHKNATDAHAEGRHGRAIGHHVNTLAEAGRALQTVDRHRRRIQDITEN